MKVIISGPRNLFDAQAVALVAAKFEEAHGKITEEVSGVAKGIDRIGEAWAEERGIPVKRFHAQWRQQGFAAGPIRNAKMGAYAQGLAAVWDGKSGGTADMIRCAHKRELLIVIYRTDKKEFSDEIPPPAKRKKKKEKPEEVQEELF